MKVEAVAVLDNIRSLHNVGSIFRTADAAGIKKLYLTGITPTPLDRLGKYRPQLAKVALGAEKNVSWGKVGRAATVISRLKKEGFAILAVEQAENSVSLYRVKLKSKEKIAFIFGSETKGLSQAILKRADKVVEIPMRGQKESLNVSVAFGIVVFSFLRNPTK